MKTFLRSLGFFLISLSMPFFLLMTAIRLLITPLYPQIEYRMPWFPSDPYGFSLEDRLRWSRVSIDYLLNDAGIEFLSSQLLPDGTPLYNDRELAHMRDVKVLVQSMVTVWTIFTSVYLILLAWAWRRGWLADLLHAFRRAGWWAMGLVVLILAGVGVSFNWLFTMFHRLFFVGDTWLFRYSDSLIRLFPLPFWRDAFILMGALTLLGGFLLTRLPKRSI